MSKKQANGCPVVDIGGQAVMEGVMMKGPDAIAIAVRRPNKDIVVKYTPYVPISKKHPWMGWPFIRGIVSMCQMLTMGMRTLNDSTYMLGVMDEEPTKFEKWLSKKLGKGIDKIVMGTAIVFAIILSVFLFFMVPTWVETWLRGAGMGNVGVNLLGGLVRILILVAYMIFCGSVPDVRRTFQYHGSEHKTVYCHENNLPLTPENAQKFTTLHPRCGTSFLLITFVLSILLHTFLAYNGDVYIWRLLSRLALLPVVAGVSYEALKGLAHSSSKIAKILRWPGMQMQRLTTRQPDDQMCEVAIVAMNCALNGLPDLPKDKDGFVVLKDYRQAEPGFVMPEAAPAAQAPAEDTAAAQA